eukprot:1703376-Amphidinium_carterae.1
MLFNYVDVAFGMSEWGDIVKRFKIPRDAYEGFDIQTCLGAALSSSMVCPFCAKMCRGHAGLASHLRLLHEDDSSTARRARTNT